MSEVSPGVQ